jgi:hypothetical protein
MAGTTTLYYRCRIVGRLHGSTTNNVIHFRETTADALTDALIQQLLTALVSAVAQCVIETLLPAVTSDWTFVRVEAQTHGTNNSDLTVFTADAGLTGEGSPASASFIASLVNLRTGGGGRSGRGKIFLPPPGEGQSADSLMDTGSADLLQAFLECLFSKFVGDTRTEGPEWVVFSRKVAGSLFADMAAANRPILQASPNVALARCGSRKLGKGA